MARACAVQLSAGSVRGKNAKNIILKNLLDACFGALGWYFFGFALAFGGEGGTFAARQNFALHEVPTSNYHNWFFQYAVSANPTYSLPFGEALNGKQLRVIGYRLLVALM